ncbi:MAG: GNAT family N-acetyltransferase [Pseudomonadota bacterium]
MVTAAAPPAGERGGRTIWRGSPRPAPSKDAAYVKILGLDDALERYATAWRALEEARPAATVFQGVGWARTYAAWQRQRDHVADGRHARAPGQRLGRGQATDAPFVLIAHADDDTVTGIWPLQSERHVGCRFAVALSEPFAQYADILIAEHVDDEAIVFALLEALRSLGQYSGLLLRKVRQDAICRPFIAADAVVVGEERAPAVDVRGYATFADYHATITTKTRKNLRNARNRLKRDGAPVVHAVVDAPDAVAVAARRALDLRARFLQARGDTSRAFLNGAFAGFVDALVGGVADADLPDADGVKLIAFELRRGEDTLSMQWGFVHGGRYYAYIAARNEAFDAQSPGRLHLEDVVRAGFDLGVSHVDFLAPAMDYKMTWANEAPNVRDYGMAFSRAGQVALLLAFGRPRQWAKSLFRALPLGARRMALRMLTRPT